jgi:hypothetical protein
MTENHKHRLVQINPGGWLYRFLRKPRWFVYDRVKAEKSAYPYGVVSNVVPPMYYLSLLGVLHRWTGLTLFYADEDH